jgi:hypothetical protein
VIWSLLLVLGNLLTADPGAQEKKTPDELTIQVRRKSGAIEFRVGYAPWLPKEQEILEQLQKAGAVPDKTKISLLLPRSLSREAGTSLENFLRQNKYTDVGEDGVVVVTTPAKAGKAPPPPAPPPQPLRIDIVHGATACDAYMKAPVCVSPKHWSVLVEKKPVEGRSELLKALTDEGAKAPDRQMRSMSARPATVWADLKAPYGLVQEVALLCQEAGLWNAVCDGNSDPAAPSVPNPGVPPAPAKEDDKIPLFLRIGVRSREGTLGLRIDKGPWVVSEREAMEKLRVTLANSNTDLLIDADPDLPWSVWLRLADLLETWGFVEMVPLAPGFPLDPPISPDAVTEAEALAIARDIDKAFKTGDPAAFDRVLHQEELIRRAIGATRLGIGMRINVRKSIEAGVAPGPQLQASGGASPALRFLSLETVDGAFRPRFRLLTHDRFDYWSFVLAKTADGSVRIVDIHSMAAGEKISESTHSSFLAEDDAIGILNSLRGGTPHDLSYCLGKKAAPMMDFLMEGQPAEALKYYAENEAELKTRKVVQRLRANIARQVGISEYARALEAFERDLPADPAHLFLRVDRYVATNNREKGLPAIDALERVVGADPLLNVFRGQLQLIAGDIAKAQALAERATADEPTLDRGWNLRLSACLARKDYAAATSAHTAAEKALKTKLENLEGLPNYAEWMKSRK